MKLISSCIFFVCFVLTTSAGSQGISFGQQIQQLDSNINATMPSESDAFESDESEKKYLINHSVLLEFSPLNYSDTPEFVFNYSYSSNYYPIRAPPLSLFF